MNSWKRSMAGLLAMVMLLSCFPGAAFAAVEDTDAQTAAQVDADAPKIAPPPDDADAPQITPPPENVDAPQSVLPPDDADALQIAPPPDDADKVPVAEKASVLAVDKASGIDLNKVYEVGYRFREDEEWQIIGADISEGIWESKLSGRFDENNCYAVSLPYNWWTPNEDGELVEVIATFPLKIYIMVWDSKGRSEEYKDNGKAYFEIEDEKDSIKIDCGLGYTFTFFTSWLEEIDYITPDGRTFSVTSDEDWYNAHKDDYQNYVDGYPNLFLFEDKTYTLELERDPAHPYANPFPYTLAFYEDNFTEPSEGVIPGETTLDFEDGKGYHYQETYPAVTFDKSGASVKVNGYTFIVKDTLAGEVYMEYGDNFKAVGADKEWADAEGHEEYAAPNNKRYEIPFGENDSFPFEVKFTLRRGNASKDIFQNLKHAELKDAPEGQIQDTVIFKQRGASVEIGEYTFVVQDERAEEILYEFVAVPDGAQYGAKGRPLRSVTVGPDAEKAEKSPVSLTDNGETENKTWTQSATSSSAKTSPTKLR